MDVKPDITRQDILCAETPAPPTGFIVFGASGDLVARKLLPGLFQLYKRELLREDFFFFGAGRKKLSDEKFRDHAQQAISKQNSDISSDQLSNFISKIYYISGDYNDGQFYRNIREKLDQLNKKHNTGQNFVFYLSIPPFLYPDVVEQLGSSGLSSIESTDADTPVKLV
ncbi:MAG: hypothetical protein ACYTBV_14120, partial [Planctomycetota bacterium]